MKVVIKWLVFVTGIIGVMVLNNVLLTTWHPVEYYYTLDGMALSAAYIGFELVVLTPVIHWLFTKTSLIKETTKFLGIDEEES